jgi:hypothetical protein
MELLGKTLHNISCYNQFIDLDELYEIPASHCLKTRFW